MRQSILWLASYPKSGNTWVRLFIANYVTNSSDPVPINQLYRFGTGDAQAKHYAAVSGGKANHADVDASLALRDRVLRGIVSNNADINLVKTHSRRAVARGVELIPPQYTRSAVYIIRNPLDMVLSYARHYAMTIEQAAEAVCHPDNAIGADANNTVQFLGSWTDHVSGWTSFAPYPVLVLRYEDMLTEPDTAFAKVVKHMGMDVDAERLERAIKHSSFDQLKQQEQASGFVERAPKDTAFFAKGQAGQWRDQLDPALVKKIRQANKRLMKQYGYWNE